jgi:poly-gamma-glutamate synthesis protein (capsule biosynthesis protein)
VTPWRANASASDLAAAIHAYPTFAEGIKVAAGVLEHNGETSAAALVEKMNRNSDSQRQIDPQSITLFLCGDVMTGRGIDQVLPHPSEPTIYEPYMDSALGYLELAERTSGPIPRPAHFSYIGATSCRTRRAVT